MTLRGGMTDNCSFPTFYYFCMGGRSAEVQSTQARHKPAGVFPGSSVPWESYWGSLSLSFLICKMRNNKLVSTSAVKNLSARAGDIGLIPGLGRSPGGGNTNLLEYSCLGSPWTEEPGGLQSMGSQRQDWSDLAYTQVRHHWSDLAHTEVPSVYCIEQWSSRSKGQLTNQLKTEPFKDIYGPWATTTDTTCCNYWSPCA